MALMLTVMKCFTATLVVSEIVRKGYIQRKGFMFKEPLLPPSLPHFPPTAENRHTLQSSSQSFFHSSFPPFLPPSLYPLLPLPLSLPPFLTNSGKADTHSRLLPNLAKHTGLAVLCDVISHFKVAESTWYRRMKKCG